MTLYQVRILALVYGAESDKELQDDDPEVEEESGNGEATCASREDQEPVRLPHRAQGYNHLQHGCQPQSDDDDHDVDQPRQHEPSAEKEVSRN